MCDVIYKIKSKNSFNLTNVGASLYCEKRRNWTVCNVSTKWNAEASLSLPETLQRGRKFAHISKSGYNLRFGNTWKFCSVKELQQNNHFGCKFNPGWKRSVAKDGKVVWFYILVFAQSPHIHQLERTKRFISWFSLGFDQIFYSEATRFILLILFCFSDSQTLFLFSNIWVNCLCVVWKWVGFFWDLFYFPIIAWHLVQTLPGRKIVQLVLFQMFLEILFNKRLTR